MQLETLGEHRCFGGKVGFYAHESEVNRCTMRFAAFVPDKAAGSTGPLPVLTYLAGLTCTEETFMIKAGAQRLAAELGIILVAPDTSPRGDGVPDDPEGGWDFGLGAGFYLDASQDPWSRHYNMYSYVTAELGGIVAEHFPVDDGRQGIFGHSMGGHGALTIGLRHPEIYSSLSAFAPICAPMRCPWGQKAFGNYLGDDRDQWRRHDASELVAGLGDVSTRPPILIDQGLDDQFLERELYPEVFEDACARVGYPLELRRHEAYDHGYYFISSFMEDHLRHHARTLLR